MNKSMIEEAEQNLVNIARQFEDVMKIMDALSSFGNNYCHDYIGKKEYFEGLSLLRSGLYKELVHAQSNCFAFVGVGGEKAAAYSRELFETQFGKDEKFAIMHFLDQFGQMPHSWKVKDEEEFRKQAQEVLNDK